MYICILQRGDGFIPSFGIYSSPDDFFKNLEELNGEVDREKMEVRSRDSGEVYSLIVQKAIEGIIIHRVHTKGIVETVE